MWGWIIAIAVILSLGLSASSSLAARVVLSCGSMGKELEVCRSSAEAWAKKTGNQVEVLASPSAAGERLAQYQLLLAAGSSDIDVFLIDTTWPGMLGEFFVDLKSYPEVQAVTPLHFKSFIENNTVEGKLVALPWFIDAGLLYYRSDLLSRYQEKVPETWSELTRVAQKIQTSERARGNAKFWGFVFQGRAYEGLTCNALEWVDSWGGGTIVNSSGQITVDSPQASQAFELAAKWLNGSNPIAPRGVLNYMEEEARGVFQSGNAAFMRNWPYALKLADAPDSPVRGKVKIAPLPQGDSPQGKHIATLGGWSLAVSKYSRSKDAAVSLVQWLARPEEQKRRAEILGQNPTIRSLYHDSELLKIFDVAVPRPSVVTGTKYNRVSSEFWDTAHTILSGEVRVQDGLKDLKKRLDVVSKGGKW
ncbi:MAG: ABC transporter substrate-binding protein [Bdellovibrionia bacterium]